MPRFFDIIPPQPKRARPKHAKLTVELKFYVLLILIMVVTFFLAQFLPTSPIKNTILESTSNINADNQNNQIQTDNTINIRIINASDKIENIDRIRELLSSISSSNYAIEQTSTVENRYDQTIVYYKPGQIEAATKLQTIIKTILDAKIEESQTLANTFDFLIIIGQK